MNLPSEYYVEPEYSTLAGPYDPTIARHRRMMQTVIEDMERGNIDYRVVDGGPNGANGGLWSYIERKGMILPKRS